MNLKRQARDAIARVFSWICGRRLGKLLADPRYFRLWEKKGIHITPVDYHQPLPNTTTLNDDIWSTESELVGINMNEEAQVNLLAEFTSNYKSEYDGFPLEKTPIPHQYYVNNGAFGRIDGEILYCMIRHFKPKLVMEIGAGRSTFLSAQALLKNMTENGGGGIRGELVSIEPNPTEILKGGFPGFTRLIEKKVQDVPYSEFERLKENDILFIDSSHVISIGNDVQYEYLEVLPRLNKGVLVHIHDIFLPRQYPKKWIFENGRFWNEQYLLQAFLTFNDRFDVQWGSSYMIMKHPEMMKMAFKTYTECKGGGGSFWIKKVK